MQNVTESQWVDVMFVEGPDDNHEPHYWPPAVYLWAKEQGLNFPIELLKHLSIKWKKEIDEEKFTGRQKEALESAFEQSLKDLKENTGKQAQEIQRDNLATLIISIQPNN